MTIESNRYLDLRKGKVLTVKVCFVCFKAEESALSPSMYILLEFLKIVYFLTLLFKMHPDFSIVRKQP